jgi:hypothetical protein
VASKTSIGYEIIKNMGGIQKNKIQKEPKKKMYGVSTLSNYLAKDENIEIPTKEKDFPIGISCYCFELAF